MENNIIYPDFNDNLIEELIDLIFEYFDVCISKESCQGDHGLLQQFNQTVSNFDFEEERLIEITEILESCGITDECEQIEEFFSALIEFFDA